MAVDINDHQINSLCKFDVELQDFLKTVIIENKQKVTDKKKHFLDALRSINTGECQSGTNSCFDLPLNRITYIFRYSPCYTSAAAHHFLEMVKAKPTIFKNAVDLKLVNICLMGGGPGTEVVALSKILSITQDNFVQNTGKKLRLRVTVVDKSIEWKETACKLLQTLVNTVDIFDQAKMVIRLRFLEADLTEPLTEDVRKAVQEADIVTMVTLLSALGKQFSKNISKFTQDIIENMKPDAILFYLDVGKTQQCHTLYKCLEIFKGVQRVYGPIELEAFTLSLQSLKRNIDLFWKTFYENICLSSTIVNSCAWMKTELNKEQQNGKYPKHVPQNSKWKAQWKKKALQTDEKLKVFHGKVKQILPSKKDFFEKASSLQSTNMKDSVKDAPSSENKSKQSSKKHFNQSKQSQIQSKKSSTSFHAKKSKDK